MVNTRLISVGIVLIIALGAVYIGNQIVKTTPPIGAVGNAQYKVVPAWTPEDVHQLATTTKPGDQVFTLMENTLNKYANDGWELVQMFGDTSFILRKK